MRLTLIKTILIALFLVQCVDAQKDKIRVILDTDFNYDV